MKPSRDISVKRIEETEPGELIQLAVRDQIINAITLVKDGSGVIVGLLSPIKDLTYLTHITLPVGRKCLSFGTDWVLKSELGPESRVGNTDYRFHTGCLYLQGEDYLLTFEGDRFGDSSICFNLSTNQHSQFPNNEHVPINSWSIWLREEHLGINSSREILKVTGLSSAI